LAKCLSETSTNKEIIVNRQLAVLLIACFGLITSADAQEVRIETDIAYLGPDRKEKLDLYTPATIPAGKRLPAVVIIHGGGWTGGDKGAKREQNIGNNLAKRGYVCVSINYLLAPKKDPVFINNLEAVWPQNLHDCKTAVRFLRKNADTYQIDPDRIGVIGGSAGGHLTALVGMTGPEDGLEPDGPYGDYSSRVQAIVPMYGAQDLTALAKERSIYESLSPDLRKLCKAGSPVTYAGKGDPPTLILHGTADTLVPVRQSELLMEALEKFDITQQLVILQDAPHSFHLQPKQADLRPLVIGFFDKHLKSR
jgi:acetyl esterase/lipase